MPTNESNEFSELKLIQTRTEVDDHFSDEEMYILPESDYDLIIPEEESVNLYKRGINKIFMFDPDKFVRMALTYLFINIRIDRRDWVLFPNSDESLYLTAELERIILEFEERLKVCWEDFPDEVIDRVRKHYAEIFINKK